MRGAASPLPQPLLCKLSSSQRFGRPVACPGALRHTKLFPPPALLRAVVWAATTQVGCGVATCSAASNPFGAAQPWVSVVCQYAPPGNVQGQYPANVKRTP